MESTAPSIATAEAPGSTPASIATPLALVSGALDPAWEVVCPGDDSYMRCFGAWRLQEDWDFNTHHWYWSQHLKLWPRREGRPCRTGLAASYAARWLRDGYSQAQVARVLGYSSPSDVPRSLWRRAADYRDWMRRAPMIRPDSPEAVAELERAYVRGVEVARSGDAASKGGPMYVLTDAVDASDPDAIDKIRTYVRRRWRTPRVVTEAEWAESPFGMPEPFSEFLLYPAGERERIKRADAALRAERPYHARTAAAAA